MNESIKQPKKHKINPSKENSSPKSENKRKPKPWEVIGHMKTGRKELIVVGIAGLLVGALLTLFTVNLAGNTLIPAGVLSPHYQGTAPQEMTDEMMERMISELRKEQRPYLVKSTIQWVDSNEVPDLMDEMLNRLEFPATAQNLTLMEREMDKLLLQMEANSQGLREGMQATRDQMDKQFAAAEKNMDCTVKTFNNGQGAVKVCVPKSAPAPAAAPAPQPTAPAANTNASPK